MVNNCSLKTITFLKNYISKHTINIENYIMSYSKKSSGIANK